MLSNELRCFLNYLVSIKGFDVAGVDDLLKDKVERGVRVIVIKVIKEQLSIRYNRGDTHVYREERMLAQTCVENALDCPEFGNHMRIPR